jgi:HEAT repeat protein
MTIPAPPASQQAAKPGPSRKAIIGWTLTMLAVLALAWFAGAVVVPYFQARSVVHEPHLLSASELRRLGPPRQAVRKLSVYLGISRLFPGECEGCRRETATWYLGKAGGEEAVPVLIDTLEDSDVGVRRYAALALCEMGPAARDAVPALAAALRDPSDDVRYAATRALGRIGPTAGAAAPALAAALKDSHVAVRRTAAESLGRIGPEASQAAPALGEALEDPDVPVRVFAAQALGMIGPGAADAIPALRATLANTDGDDGPRKAAAEALKKIKAPSAGSGQAAQEKQK